MLEDPTLIIVQSVCGVCDVCVVCVCVCVWGGGGGGGDQPPTLTLKLVCVSHRATPSGNSAVW